TH
ncbi:hypothetical protein EC950183_1352, partial [Escherichia coli 95.0183]